MWRQNSSQIFPPGHRLAREGFIMKDCMITFRSVTPAQTAEGLFQKANIRCQLRRTPRWLQEQGCGYSLWLSRKDTMEAVSILREMGVAFRKVYLQTENGAARELEL